MLALVFGLCACKEEAPEQQAPEQQQFSSAWTSDEEYHWHEATGENAGEKYELTRHIWGSLVDNKNGTATYTCKVCKKKVTRNLPSVISMVNTGPGEDASKGVVISWHSTSEGSLLEYKKTEAESWTVVSNSDCNETPSTADWKTTKGAALDASHYRCKVYLNDLSPDSTYNYRIKDSSGNYSEVAFFKTAKADTTTFQFMWLSDNHVPKGGEKTLERVSDLIAYAQSKDDVDIDFVLFSGDMVNKGQIYEHWNYWSDSGLLGNMTYAFVAGNHDYYGWNNSNRTTNDYYKEFAAYPANNTAGDKSVLDSNYWFIWNRVLFVCIDSMTEEGQATGNLSGASLSDQKAWFKAVCDANKGKYDYLIYAQHYPWFHKDTYVSSDDYGNYAGWRKLFDTYKVDFALSSDEHTYRRTYALYNNKNPNYDNSSNPTVEKAEMKDGKVSKGTVYVVSNLTQGSSVSSLKNTAASNLNHVQYTAEGVGGVYFTVTPTEMTLHLIGSGGREFDTITVLKKDRN